MKAATLLVLLYIIDEYDDAAIRLGLAPVCKVLATHAQAALFRHLIFHPDARSEGSVSCNCDPDIRRRLVKRVHPHGTKILRFWEFTQTIAKRPALLETLRTASFFTDYSAAEVPWEDFLLACDTITAALPGLSRSQMRFEALRATESCEILKHHWDGIILGGKVPVELIRGDASVPLWEDDRFERPDYFLFSELQCRAADLQPYCGSSMHSIASVGDLLGDRRVRSLSIDFRPPPPVPSPPAPPGLVRKEFEGLGRLMLTGYLSSLPSIRQFVSWTSMQFALGLRVYPDPNVAPGTTAVTVSPQAFRLVIDELFQAVGTIIDVSYLNTHRTIPTFTDGSTLGDLSGMIAVQSLCVPYDFLVGDSTGPIRSAEDIIATFPCNRCKIRALQLQTSLDYVHYRDPVTREPRTVHERGIERLVPFLQQLPSLKQGDALSELECVTVWEPCAEKSLAGCGAIGRPWQLLDSTIAEGFPEPIPELFRAFAEVNVMLEVIRSPISPELGDNLHFRIGGIKRRREQYHLEPSYGYDSGDGDGDGDDSDV